MTQQAHGDLDVAHRSSQRCYLINDICRELKMSRRTFFMLRKAGKLPFLEELKPRLGSRERFRAEPIDRFLNGQWGQSKHFASARNRHTRRIA